MSRASRRLYATPAWPALEALVWRYRAHQVRVIGGNGVTNNGVGALLPTTGAAVAVDDPVVIPLDPQDGAIITAYRVWVDPAAHHPARRSVA